MLKLMYITNKPEIAKIAEKAGVDRIFLDMEYIGKEKRQGGMDTVQSHHTIEDIQNMREKISEAELLVRCNPIHDSTDEYKSSKEEIDDIVRAGADIIMLPYFKTIDEIRRFFEYVNGRVHTCLLVETPEAVEIIDEILSLPEVEEIHIGLNDLSLAYGMRFMFEPLKSGIVDELCVKFKQRGIRYGFGGVASLGQGTLPAEKIIIEHYRLGSSIVILSRSFLHPDKCEELDMTRKYFNHEVEKIRNFEKALTDMSKGEMENNKEIVVRIIEQIINK